MARLKFYTLLLIILLFNPEEIIAQWGGCGGGCGGGCAGGNPFGNLFGGYPNLGGNPFATPAKLCNEVPRPVPVPIKPRPEPIPVEPAPLPASVPVQQSIVTPACGIPSCSTWPGGCRTPACMQTPVLPYPVYQTRVMTACKKCPEQLYLPPLEQTPKLYPETAPEDVPSLTKQITIHKVIPTPTGEKDIQKIIDITDNQRPVPLSIIPRQPYVPVQPTGGCGYLPQFPYTQAYPQSYPYTPYGYGYGYRPPQVIQPQPYAQPLQPLQSCCASGSCPGGCGKVKKAKNRRALSEKIHVDGVVSRNYTCSNEQLKKIMLNSYASTMSLAKLEIQQDAELILGPSFHVICSAGDFDYVTRTSVYCQIELEHGVCYAFQT